MALCIEAGKCITARICFYKHLGVEVRLCHCICMCPYVLLRCEVALHVIAKVSTA